MTIKQQVLDFLNANSTTPYTNGDIAHELGVPEPSVRRATSQLELASWIRFYDVTSRGRTLYSAL